MENPATVVSPSTWPVQSTSFPLPFSLSVASPASRAMLVTHGAALRRALHPAAVVRTLRFSSEVGESQKERKNDTCACPSLPLSLFAILLCPLSASPLRTRHRSDASSPFCLCAPPRPTQLKGRRTAPLFFATNLSLDFTLCRSCSLPPPPPPLRSPLRARLPSRRSACDTAAAQHWHLCAH